MKVLHICTIDSGGAFQAAYNLHLGLLNESVASKMLVLIKTQENLKGVYYFLENHHLIQKVFDSINYRVFKWKKKRFLKGNLKSLYSLPSSPYDISEHPLFETADLVHLHWVAEFLDYHTFFRKVKKKVFWTLHDRSPFSGGFHFLSYTNHSYQNIDEKLIREKNAALSDFNDLIIISPSKWLYNDSKGSKVLGSFDHYLISYGVDTKTFKPQDKLRARKELKLPSDKKIILFVADSLEDKRKGFDYLLNALKCLEQKDHVLLTVGSGNLHGIETTIKSMGFIQDKELMTQIYSAADVFVIPSIEDNLPNTVLESLSCGTPVVGFNVGGIPDMIRHRFNGYLVGEINANGLAQGIITVLNDLASFNSHEIRVDCLNRFSMQKQALDYIDLYKNKLVR